ncbi:Panacea domain-containing protein [Aestuariispira insulae]|uniref:Putative phage-associated protein n=1 Tax=Aestuariispira insulae TaxID=1461337 RepID=A0A3D9HN95_9PROT|nr:hypothetical protein [Aestuariispira insulae]RED50977.1 putative phage-associated protein [Aestuariispira insulae]
MTTPAVPSAIDVANWFAEIARKEDIYLQPQKLQRLLYISQGSYAAMNYGRKLMPATFVADETGPLEPNVYRVFELGRPKITAYKMPPEIENFLARIWRKYCHHSTDYINQQIQYHEIYMEAIRKGHFEEIPFDKIVRFFSGREKPKIQRKQKKVVTADGRKLEKWLPTAQATSRPTNR